MSRPRKYPPELLDRGLRMVQESGRPIAHVAKDLGVSSEMLRKRVCQAEADGGERPAPLTTGEQEELRRLRREVSQLRRAKAILKDTTAYFAAELDPTRQR
jgi:transposase